jgi:hypothetical protein
MALDSAEEFTVTFCLDFSLSLSILTKLGGYAYGYIFDELEVRQLIFRYSATYI